VGLEIGKCTLLPVLRLWPSTSRAVYSLSIYLSRTIYLSSPTYLPIFLSIYLYGVWCMAYLSLSGTLLPVPDATEGTSIVRASEAGSPHDDVEWVASTVFPSASYAFAVSVPGA
jgi:hypothetical protein